MNVKTIVIFIITSMMIMTMFASTAVAITVDGLVSPANEWDGDWVKDDPCGPETHGMGNWGYNLEKLYQHYDGTNDTLYFRLDVCGIPADLDGNGNTGTVCAIPPGDCPGVGPYEQYTIILSDNINPTGKPGVEMQYKNNAVSLAPSLGSASAKWGTGATACVEFKLDSASSYVDPEDYCIWVSAGGLFDSDGVNDYAEDVMHKCLYLVVQLPPTFSFTWSQKCDLNVRFSGHGTDDGNIVNHTWDFGDGSAPVTSNGPPGTTYHPFPDNGTYTVTLSGYDNDGLSGTTSQTVHVAFVPCQDVPVQTPPGIAALIGLLGLIGAGVIMRRR